MAQDYDVVLLDPPPALGTISLAVMQAANALLIPLAATTPDFCSTVQFLSMMDQVIGQLNDAGIAVEYDFCRLICSKFSANDPSHTMVQQIMDQAFGPALLPVPILESAEISHAALRMMTIYELDKPVGTPRTDAGAPNEPVRLRLLPELSTLIALVPVTDPAMDMLPPLTVVAPVWVRVTALVSVAAAVPVLMIERAPPPLFEMA